LPKDVDPTLPTSSKTDLKMAATTRTTKKVSTASLDHSSKVKISKTTMMQMLEWKQIRGLGKVALWMMMMRIMTILRK
jgi:hypothetical protein